MENAALPPILVVDDNHDNAEIIRQYLEIRGYPITVAHNGDEALALFETVRPALVLLDVMMPGRDGWEVCRVMKQHPTLGRTVRIIMVTALDEWQDKREALQIGADDYVEKPFDLPTLAVDGAAQSRHAARHGVVTAAPRGPRERVHPAHRFRRTRRSTKQSPSSRGGSCDRVARGRAGERDRHRAPACARSLVSSDRSRRFCATCDRARARLPAFPSSWHAPTTRRAAARSS